MSWLFASDLDRTLIYSRLAVESLGSHVPLDLQLVEQREDQGLSYMTSTAVALLCEVAAQMPFVPVTTRTTAQYERIFLFADEIVPNYAVTSNGGRVLVRGQLDADWSAGLRLRLEQESLAAPDLLRQFQELKHPDWVLREGVADELFYYCLIERDKMPVDEVASFARQAAASGWSVSVQGRKIYLVPRAVNKGDAVRYVQGQLGITRVAAAGDSLLDLSLLRIADLRLVPPHGELGARRVELADEQLLYTATSGVRAAEELLQAVLDREQVVTSRQNWADLESK